MARQRERIPAVVEDLLETWYGRWFTIEVLIDHVIDLRPAAALDHVRRAVERVLSEPTITIQLRRVDGRREVSCPHRSYLG